MKQFDECDHLNIQPLFVNGKLIRIACRDCGFIGKVVAKNPKEYTENDNEE